MKKILISIIAAFALIMPMSAISTAAAEPVRNVEVAEASSATLASSYTRVCTAPNGKSAWVTVSIIGQQKKIRIITSSGFKGGTLSNQTTGQVSAFYSTPRTYYRDKAFRYHVQVAWYGGPPPLYQYACNIWNL